MRKTVILVLLAFAVLLSPVMSASLQPAAAFSDMGKSEYSHTISQGMGHSAAISIDGSLYIWGNNASGQLGLGDIDRSPTPTKVPGLTNVISVGLGTSYSAAVTADGSLYTWGDNQSGQLGLGDRGHDKGRNTPQKVPGISNVVSVTLGDGHSAAITADGSLYMWGLNQFGQLGFGEKSYNNTTPKKVTGLTDVVAVSLSGERSAAITADGSLYTWGRNDENNLGFGDTVSRYAPTKVPGLSNVTAVCSGWHHTMALTADGSVYVWGRNQLGQLGLGDTEDRYTPVKVPGLSGISAISVGSGHSMALTTSGDLYVWGDNWTGQLGIGDIGQQDSPFLMQDLKNVVAISTGECFNAAITADGSLYTWGDNWNGQLGIGEFPRRAIVPQFIMRGIRMPNGQTVSTEPVTIKVASGAGGTAAGGGSFAPGTEVTLAATPYDGYIFDGWYANGAKIDGAGRVYSLIALTNETLEARFVRNPFGFHPVTSSVAASNNANRQDYSSGVNATTAASYLVKDRDGHIKRIEFVSGKIVVETYSPSLALVERLESEPELPLFGGFYEGTDCYFIVFGQNNPNEAYDAETYRIVKYDKNFNRIDSASITGGDSGTVEPFRSGGLSMAENGNELIIHTSRLMFRASDGARHQSNITIRVNLDTMKSTCDGSIYVTHSFNQFVRVSQGTEYFVDHGDAYPRSVVLQTRDSGHINLLDILGTIGANHTGVSVGGFELSNTSALVVGGSVAQDANFSSNKTRNIFLSATTITPITKSSGLTWLSNYEEGGANSGSTPVLVKISNNLFAVMWQIKTRSDTSSGSYQNTGTLSYIFVNGKGESMSGVITVDAQLSDCAPIINGDKILWYVTGNSTPVFYALDYLTFELEQIFPSADKPSSWAEDQVYAAIAAKLVPQALQSKYTQAATRAEFCALAVALYETVTVAEITGRAQFGDTTDVNVEKMAALGVVNGVGDGRFDPDAGLTREQAATMLARLANVIGKPFPASSPTFADSGAVSLWAIDAVGGVQAAQIMGGVGENTFAPKGDYTREQSIVTMLRLFYFVK